MTSTDIIPAIRTDHNAISLKIGELENELRGPGYWKMNCSLLADEEYVNSVTESIQIWAAEGRKELSDDRSLWDWINITSELMLAGIQKRSRKKGKRKN